MKTNWLTVICILSSFGPVLAADRLHSAVDPMPRLDKWWNERHESMNKRVAELGEKAEVIFIGDSITQGWEGEGKQAWGQILCATQRH